MEGIEPKTILVFVLIAIAAVSAVGVVAFSSAIRSALSLVVNFFTLAFLYFTLQAELLGITQVVVYTGAIMVLFLFVVMLLNLGGSNMLQERGDIKRILGIAFGLVLAAIILTQVVLPLQGTDSRVWHVASIGMTPNKGFETGQEPAPVPLGGPEAIGRSLFTTYAWPFEIASVLLLIGIVGSILLAKRRI